MTTTEAAGARRADPFLDEEDDPIAAAALLGVAARPADPSAIKSIAESRGFASREPTPASLAPAPQPAAPTRARRVHRTGRNRQLTIKISEEAFSQFYAMADKQGIVLGEAFQQALNAWSEKLNGPES